MKKYITFPALFIAILCCFSVASSFAQKKNYAQYVNPMIGTGGHGHTFPGATVPFGMVQLSPDTRIDDSWDGCSGYHYSDSVIYGFSHTHLSGTGCSDYGDLMIMPTMGNVNFESAKYGSGFSHKNERAKAGYYAVKLDDDNIDVELTATTRVGLHKYTFNKAGTANLIMDFNHRDKLIFGEVKVISDTVIEVMRESEAWARDQVVYAVIMFSRPVKVGGTNSMGGKRTNDPFPVYNGNVLKVAFSCDVKQGESLMVKVALSNTGYAGAGKNLATELRTWDFEKTKRSAEALWDNELNKIDVTSADKDKLSVFYTALYHTMIQPNVNMDVDGMYRGMDRKIHKAEGFTYYSVFSLWDTFRAAHPLYTIIDKKRTLDFIKTFLAHYRDGGRLPVWELASNETDCMIGYHSVSVIADAAIKGISDFDQKQALEAMKKSATWDHYGLPAYIDHGCLTLEDEHESVSKTLEYAYDDWCIAKMAGLLHNAADANVFMARSQSWKNLFDAGSGFMRPKKNGGWITPFEPREVNNNFTEGNSWQYSFFVPQDIGGLIAMMGGASKFEEKLDGLFNAPTQTTGREQVDITGLIGQYAQGNEPSHHMAYIYDFVGKSSKTEEKIIHILDDFYKNSPDGLIGNEDCGQMSAWYVLSSLGFYQVTPGNPQFAIGSPLFEKAVIHLENGKDFTVIAENLSAKNRYIQSAGMNKEKYVKNYFTYADLMNGNTLKFKMGEKAVNWEEQSIATKFDEPAEQLIVPSPVIDAASKTFKNSLPVALEATEAGDALYYTTDGTMPTTASAKYTAPFTIDENKIIKVIAVNKNGKASFVSTGMFYKIPHPDWKIKINAKYNPQYTAGGDEGIIDGMHGTENWRKGEWQGYQSQDFEAIVDLAKEQTVTTVSSTYLQDSRAWILMPVRVEYSFSTDGITFSAPLQVVNTVEAKDYKVQLNDFVKTLPAPVQARYVKVKAVNYGALPAWHQGVGGDAFIFIDEIDVK